MAFSGLLLMLAFPRPGWGWIAFIALVPAAVAAGRTFTWRRLFWTSAVVWGAWWMWMLGWLLPISPAAPFAVGAWLGLHAAGALLAAGVLNQKLRWPMVAALPLGWISVEVLRSAWPAGGLAWFTLAHTQAMWDTGDVGRVVQTADLLGQHTVGLVVAVVNGGIADVLLRRRLPRKSVGIAAVVLLSAWSYGQLRISQFGAVTREGPRLAVVQTNIIQDNEERPTLEQLVDDFTDLAGLHMQAAASSDRGDPVDLVVWPETIVPGPLNEQGVEEMRRLAADPGMSEFGRSWYGLRSDYARAVSDLVASGGVATVAGAGTLETEPHVRRYNSAHFYDMSGERTGVVYHKQHRVPMGEYIPGPWFIESLIAWMSPWNSEYTLTPGDGPVVFTLPGGHQVAAPICYEDVAAAICRRMVYADGTKRLDALVNLTNDGWYAGVAMRRQHAQLASLRCIENRVPMARSVNTGMSTIIDSLGRCSVRLDAFEAGTLAHTVRVDDRHTLYAAIGGWPWALFVLFTLGATAVGAVFGRPVAKHRIA